MIKMKEKEKGIALVTGASSGLGKIFAQRMDEMPEVSEIWLVARREQRLEALSQALKTPCRVFPLDLTGDLCPIKEALQEPSVHVQYLVNAAGYGKIGQLGEVALEDNVGMIELNCAALVELTQLTLPYLNRGAIVYNVASVAAFLPQPEFAVYAASKAFVRSFSLAIGEELAFREKEIQVIAICPNPMETEFFYIASGGVQKKAKTIKKIGVEDAEEVVDTAISRAERGRSQSINSIYPKLIHFASRIFPWNFILWFERKFLGLFK